jgi:uncharacterized protein (DUF983 family)
VKTAEGRHFAPVSVAHAAFARRCPRCGEGRRHLMLWTPLILGGAIVMLRPLKAALIALQYKRHLLHHGPPSV